MAIRNRCAETNQPSNQFGVEQYLSIAAGSAPGTRPSEPLRRLVATVANPTANLWTVPITDGISGESAVKPFTVADVRASSPRFGREFILYQSYRGGGETLVKF